MEKGKYVLPISENQSINPNFLELNQRIVEKLINKQNMKSKRRDKIRSCFKIEKPSTKKYIQEDLHDNTIPKYESIRSATKITLDPKEIISKEEKKLKGLDDAIESMKNKHLKLMPHIEQWKQELNGKKLNFIAEKKFTQLNNILKNKIEFLGNKKEITMKNVELMLMKGKIDKINDYIKSQYCEKLIRLKPKYAAKEYNPKSNIFLLKTFKANKFKQ